MLKLIKKILFLLLLFCLSPVFANQSNDTQNIMTAEEILAIARQDHQTPCAHEIFSHALAVNSDKITQDNLEHEVRVWAQQTMQDAEVLEQILQCPEVASAADNETIVFTPVIYRFPNDRTITINYSTQPRVIKQKLILARKPSLPTNDPNPQLMNPDDPGKYINTEPAWYAIMVVQHDSLKDFVGPGKNNTLSMHYLEEHIDEIYPKGYFCTSRSAIANDSDTINNVVRKVVDVEKDSNDYYVAGDINLEWVMYAEIVGEIILAIVTWGGSTIVEGAIQTARIVKDIKNLSKTLKGLMKMDKVKDFLKIGRQITQHADDIAKLEKTIQHADDYAKIMKNIEKAEKAGKDATKYRKEAEDLLKAAKKVDSNITPEKLKNTEKLKNQRNEIKNTMKKLEKDADDLAKQHKEVKEFKEASETYGEAMKYYRNLRAFKRAKTGNIVTRTLKSFKTLRTGGRTLRKANRVARAGLSSRSAKIGSWLMDNTLKHGSRLARFEAKVGLAYGAVALVGDMFDYTSSTSKEFSNGIVFKPYCLLSADDLEGQDNVVNYGMWLMWEGNSTDTADDDAAYLQAMDFAAKLEYQLNEYQSELPPVKVVDMMLSPTPVPRSAFLCNVDIYVVHPIIRLDESNTDDPKGELYYLFMNEIPWTTAEQFGEAVPDIQEWERNQQQLYDEDGHYKHTKKPENNQNAPDTPENNSNDNTQTPENDSGVLK